MGKRFRELVLHKQSGNMTSFFIGIMYIMVVIILMLIAIRVTMVSECLYYIDDALTGAVLGGATANEAEYGRSNQILLQNTDDAGYIDYISSKYNTGLADNSARNGWEQKEADILVSELNYNSTVFADYTYLQQKKIKDLEANGVRSINIEDEELIDNISDMLNVLRINLTNSVVSEEGSGRFSGSLNPEVYDYRLYSGGTVTDSALLNALTVKDSELSESALDEYVVSDIKVTRLEVYNVFRQTLADRHIYASENLKYMIQAKTNSHATVTSVSDLTYQELKNNIYSAESGKSGKIVPDTNSILNDSRYDIYIIWSEASAESDAYRELLRQQRLANDTAFFSGKTLTSYVKADTVGAICFTDTAVTYQQAYDRLTKNSSGEGEYYINNREYYGFMFPMNVNYEDTAANNQDDTVVSAQTIDAAAVSIVDPTYRYGREKLRSAIEGYTVYSYVLDGIGTSVDTQISNPNQGNYIDLSGETTPVSRLILSDFNNDASAVDDRTHDNTSIYNKSKEEGGKIYNTTLYLELTFKISTFGEVNSLFSIGEANAQEVVVGRLVDIDPYYEEE